MRNGPETTSQMLPNIHQAPAEKVAPPPVLGLGIPSSRLLIFGTDIASGGEFLAADSPDLISRRLHDEL